MKFVNILHNLSIRYKLIVVIALTSGAALLLASLALIASDFISFRQSMSADLLAVASIIGENATSALSSDDSAAARDILEGLRSREHIVLACIDGPTGVFARYSRDDDNIPCPAGSRSDRTEWASNALGVYHPIDLSGQQLGTVYIRSDLGETFSRLRLQLGSLAVVLVISTVFAVALSVRVQRLISVPLLDLLRTTQGVSRGDNYSLRAIRRTNDELGELVDSFNRMLAQIEERDAMLRQAKEELEQRVHERTEQLTHELAERRRAEAELVKLNNDLQHSNRELDDFAYVASHDLKEPLRGIHSYAVFLLEDYGERFDAEARARLETLKRLSQRMDSLIDTLLHYARVGRLDLSYQMVDLNELVSDVKEALAVRLKETGAEIRVPHPLPKIWADRTRTAEVLHNLVSNALKYNDKPEKWVEIGALPGDGSGPVFYVRDNGIGIPAKHLESIFRIFKRLHARDKYGGGTGAGLTIVRKIVERHHGRVWAESREGAGTTFYFTLHGGTTNE